jgi:hypothetical protein
MSRHLFTLDSLSPARQQEVMEQLHPTHGKDQDRRSPPRAELECSAGHAPVEPLQTQAQDPGKHIVRVTSYRARLLDEDNLAEKWHVDALRYAGCIPDDAPAQTHIEVSQVKVAKKDQRTEIEITYP